MTHTNDGAPEGVNAGRGGRKEFFPKIPHHLVRTRDGAPYPKEQHVAKYCLMYLAIDLAYA